MARRCPAAAYLSSISGQEQTSSFNTEDLDPTRSFEYEKAFLRDVVTFMYRCHAYVKKAKEQHPGVPFKLCNEKLDNLQEILNIIKQREKASKEQVGTRDKIHFDPRGKSSPVSTYAGQTHLTGTPVSGISNLMGNRDFPTPPRIYKSSQGSSGFSKFSSNLPYGVSSSSASTDAGSAEAVRICGPPGQDLSTSYPSYASYPCPYNQRSMNMTPYGSSRGGQPSIRPQQYVASPAYSYERSYAASPLRQNITAHTAQTSFYEYPRCPGPAECFASRNESQLGYIEDEGGVDLNTAFIEDEDAYGGEYEEDDGQDAEYASYVPPDRTIRCACK